MAECYICKAEINWDRDKFYHQRKVEDGKLITVILCENCMAENTRRINMHDLIEKAVFVAAFITIVVIFKILFK